VENKKNKQGAVFVVGGSGGLGSAICRRLLDEWDSVFFTYHSNREAALTLKASLSEFGAVECCAMDITDAAAISAAFDVAIKHFDCIDAVVFASGVAIEQPFVINISTEQWAEVIAVELTGFTRLVAQVLPLFRQQGGGNLVSVVSFAPYHFPPGDALSAVPKAGIEVLCRGIAKEEGRYGVRANSVAPGIINAGLGEAFQHSLYTPEIWAGQKKRVALKRFGEGDEVAKAVCFLASENSSYITGQTLIVDGGMSL
jgi:NAD(P)-dependent dehydrogenase (short-subunit alcohol dehydrogenase family)